MKRAGGTEAGTRRTVPVWVKLLIGFHVFASVVWALPQPPPAVANGKVQPQATLWLLFWNAKYLKVLPPVQAYALSLGAWQYWDMFAPDPSNTDWYCTADVTYRDGTEKTIAYPRMYELPIPMKYVKERYRKFYERASGGAGQERLWPSFAQVMARWAYTDPKNPPVLVRLKQHTLRIADPGEKQATKYDELDYFDYAVDGRLLRREAATR